MDEFQDQITPDKRRTRMGINQMSSHAKKRTTFCQKTASGMKDFAGDVFGRHIIDRDSAYLFKK